MKRFFVLAAFVSLIFMGSVYAQQQGRPSVEDRVKTMKERLKLTDDQVTQVTKILQDNAEKMKKIPRGEGFDERRKIMEETSASIEKILTDTQKAEYQKMREERRNGGGYGGGRSRGN